MVAHELGEAWRDGKVHLPLLSFFNGAPFGAPEAGTDMTFDFATLVAHAAKTRSPKVMNPVVSLPSRMISIIRRSAMQE